MMFTDEIEKLDESHKTLKTLRDKLQLHLDGEQPVTGDNLDEYLRNVEEAISGVHSVSLMLDHYDPKYSEKTE